MGKNIDEWRGRHSANDVLDGEGHVVNHWVGYASGRNGERLREAIETALKG